jgi:hypothetical protein
MEVIKQIYNVKSAKFVSIGVFMAEKCQNSRAETSIFEFKLIFRLYRTKKGNLSLKYLYGASKMFQMKHNVSNETLNV